MNPASTQFAVYVFATGILIYALFRLVELAYVELSRKGKARILWRDEDGGELRITFHTREGNEIVVGEGETARRYILEGPARMNGRYPTWELNPRTGWNYMAPTDGQTINKDRLLARLVVSNPATYHRAISRNKARDALRANDEEKSEGWVVPVVIGMCVALLIILGMVAVIFNAIGRGAGGGVA